MDQKQPRVLSLANVGASRPARPGLAYVGPVPPEVFEVVRQAHEIGFSPSSNYARERALYVALAASLGWITVVDLTGRTYSRYWKSTYEGLIAHNNHMAATRGDTERVKQGTPSDRR